MPVFRHNKSGSEPAAEKTLHLTGHRSGSLAGTDHNHSANPPEIILMWADREDRIPEAHLMAKGVNGIDGAQGGGEAAIQCATN